MALIDDTGVDRDSIDTVAVTHAHADHAGGAVGLKEGLGASIMASTEVARILTVGDAEAASVPVGQSSGAYPPDYEYRACPVDRELHDGDRFQVGDVEIEVIATPGHATGHLCYLVHAGDRKDLFSGDMLLFGGRLIIQNTWDCESVAYLESVRRLRDLSIDGFFPGHFSFSVERGQRHIDIANAALDNGRFPPVL